MPIFDVNASLEGYLLPGVSQNAVQVQQGMQARTIDRAVLRSVRAVQADPLSGNRILKAMLDQASNLFGCLVTHTNRVDSSLQAIKDMLGGRKFVAVMVASIDPEEPLHPLVADEIMNACRRYQKPIYLLTPNAACVESALHLAKTYNMHRFVFVGMGGHDWRTAIAAAHQSVNISLEMSGPLDRGKLPAAVEAIGNHRILFGSNSPTCDPAAGLGLVEDSELSALDKRRILYDNAAKLFAVDEEETQ